MSNYVTPGQQRHLRACMVCSIVMTIARFRDYGCPNCEEMLSFRGSPDTIDSCTSPIFDGVMTINDPTKSWIAKWQRLDGYVKGVYALKVSGTLPEEIIGLLEEDFGVKYIPRDGTADETEA